MAELLLENLALGGSGLGGGGFGGLDLGLGTASSFALGLVLTALVLPLQLHLVDVLQPKLLDLLGVVAAESRQLGLRNLGIGGSRPASNEGVGVCIRMVLMS